MRLQVPKKCQSDSCSSASASLASAAARTSASAGAHYSLGRSLQLSNKLDEAIKELELAERFKPGAAMTAALASALRDKGDLGRAESVLRGALAKSPRSLVAHCELARVLAAAKKCKDADAELSSLPADKETVAETRRAVTAACPAGAKR